MSIAINEKLVQTIAAKKRSKLYFISCYSLIDES